MAKMHEYTHTVQYYETDQMAIVHHSNYIRWMEEARVAILDANGCGYVEMEARGIVSPVVSVTCRYKEPTKFGDSVLIRAQVTGYNGVRLSIHYEMTNLRTGNICAVADSEHCFLAPNGRPTSLARVAPEYDAAMKKLM